MKAFLILEDGTVFEGKSVGACREVVSEIVFNTSMTGYLEVLTDPSYAGQAVTMTYPLIGNYGVTYADMESRRAWPDGFIMREIARMPSNFRCDDTLQSFLERQDIPGIYGIDTRALTKLLREKGTMNGMITTNENYRSGEVISRLKEYRVTDVVKRVSRREKESFLPGDLGSGEKEVKYKTAVIDVGTKNNIIRCLLNRGCAVDVYPCDVKAEDIIAAEPDGIMITNGPGDPAECVGIIKEIKKLADSGIPVFAICLGHQLMALAHGFGTFKMKYGHRGANHPVMDLHSRRVYISSQNHGYVVDGDSLNPAVAKPWFINVNDKSIEGLEYVGKPVKTVQFHPEANAGPKDSEILFEEFIKMMGGAR